MAQLQRPRKQKEVVRESNDAAQDELGLPPDIASFEQEIHKIRSQETQETKAPATSPSSSAPSVITIPQETTTQVPTEVQSEQVLLVDLKGAQDEQRGPLLYPIGKSTF